MTDHEPFQQEPQNPQDPQVVVFSPELLKLADRRRQALEDCRQAALPGRRLSRCVRAVSNSSPMKPRRRSQQRKVYLGLSVSGRVGLAALVMSAWWEMARHS